MQFQASEIPKSNEQLAYSSSSEYTIRWIDNHFPFDLKIEKDFLKEFIDRIDQSGLTQNVELCDPERSKGSPESISRILWESPYYFQDDVYSFLCKSYQEKSNDMKEVCADYYTIGKNYLEMLDNFDPQYTSLPYVTPSELKSDLMKNKLEERLDAFIKSSMNAEDWEKLTKQSLEQKFACYYEYTLIQQFNKLKTEYRTVCYHTFHELFSKHDTNIALKTLLKSNVAYGSLFGDAIVYHKIIELVNIRVDSIEIRPLGAEPLPLNYYADTIVSFIAPQLCDYLSDPKVAVKRLENLLAHKCDAQRQIIQEKIDNIKQQTDTPDPKFTYCIDEIEQLFVQREKSFRALVETKNKDHVILNKTCKTFGYKVNYDCLFSTHNILSTSINEASYSKKIYQQYNAINNRFSLIKEFVDNVGAFSSDVQPKFQANQQITKSNFIQSTNKILQAGIQKIASSETVVLETIIEEARVLSDIQALEYSLKEDFDQFKKSMQSLRGDIGKAYSQELDKISRMLREEHRLEPANLHGYYNNLRQLRKSLDDQGNTLVKKLSALSKVLVRLEQHWFCLPFYWWGHDKANRIREALGNIPMSDLLSKDAFTGTDEQHSTNGVLKALNLQRWSPTTFAAQKVDHQNKSASASRELFEYTLRPRTQ